MYKVARIYRFRDKVALFAGTGETVYLSADEALALAQHLNEVAFEVRNADFVHSLFRTMKIAMDE